MEEFKGNTDADITQPIYKCKTEENTFKLYENRLVIESENEKSVISIKNLFGFTVDFENCNLCFRPDSDELYFSFGESDVRKMKKLLSILEELL